MAPIEVKLDASAEKSLAEERSWGDSMQRSDRSGLSGLRASVKAHKRNQRETCCESIIMLFIVLGIAYLGWVAYCTDSLIKTTSFTYDATVGLHIKTKACEILFQPGTTPTAVYTASQDADNSDKVTDASGSIVSEVHALNNAGCGGWPRGACAGKCLLTVDVPPEAAGAHFSVGQFSGDAFSPRAIIASGVTMGSFNIGVDHTKVPSVNLFLRSGAVITGTLSGHLIKGSLTAQGATVGDFALVSEAGSVRLFDQMAPAGSPMEIVYRAGGPSCFTTDVPTAVFTPLEQLGNAFAKCDIGVALDGATSSTGALPASITDSLDKLKANYDPDGDGFVSDAEARAGLNNMGCFGGNCPFGSKPDPWIYELGLGAVAAIEGTGQVTTLALAKNLIQNTNYTGWIPDCPTSVVVDTSSAPPTTVAPATTFSTIAAGGDLHVHLKQTSCQFGVDCPGRSVYGGTGSGLAMAGGSAAKMMRDFAPKYGDIGTTGHVFMAIDVRGGPGVPNSRWVYTTSPAHLVMNPMTTSWLLTFGVMQPDIARIKLDFVDNDCTYLASNRTDEAVERAYARIAEHITRSLKTNPENVGGAVRGVLVLVNEESKWGDSPSTVYKYMTTTGSDAGEGVRMPWSNEGAETAVYSARLVSIIATAMCSVFLFMVLWKYLSYVNAVRYNEKVSQRYMMLRKSGISRKKIKEHVHNIPIRKPSWNPFFEAVEAVTTLLVEPFTRRYASVNSLGLFLDHRMEKTTGTDQSFVYMRTFMEWYEHFCLQEGIPAIEDPDEIQRALIKAHPGVAVQQIKVSRIYGMRWKGPEDPALDDTAKVEAVDASVFSSDAADPNDVIGAFLNAKCVVDLAPGVFIDMQERNGPDGKLVPGFAKSLLAWCKENKTQAIDISSNDINWDRLMPVGVSLRWNTLVRQIRGLKLRAADVDDKETCTQAIWDRIRTGSMGATILNVAVQLFVVVLGPTFFLLSLCINYEDQWSWLNVPAGGVPIDDNGNKLPPLGWGDFAALNFGIPKVGNVYTTQISSVLLVVAVLMLFGLPRLLVAYVAPVNLFGQYYMDDKLATKKGLNDYFRSICVQVLLDGYCHFHALVLAIYWLAFLAWLSASFSWTLLAACLMPTTVLPLGASYIAVVYVGYKSFTSARKAAAKLEMQLDDAFDMMLQPMLRQALDRLEQEQIEAGKTLNVLPKGGRDATLKASDLFLALTKYYKGDKGIEDDGTMTIDDIDRMFAAFQLDVTAKERDQFFAYCDLDGDEKLTASEFQAGWDNMMKEKLRRSLKLVGISQEEAIFGAFVAIATMVMLSMFIIFGINAFTTTDGAIATIQSLVIAGASRGVGSIRADAAEDAKGGAEALVKKILQERKDAAQE